MKRTSAVIFSSLVALIMASCSSGGFHRTESGLLYKIISGGGKGAAVKNGQFVKINFKNTLRDSVLSSSYGALPAYPRVDSVGPVYNPMEVFPLLHKGDSAIIILLADTLKAKQGGLPPFIKDGDKIVLTVKVLDILDSQEQVKADQQAAMAEEKAREVTALKAYLDKNKINAKMTADSVFYIIDQPGDGPKADSGKNVAVEYTGYNTKGQFFDSNVDSTKQTQPHPLTPFTLKAGVGGAIDGMVSGITEFHQGDKGRLFVPGVLAYGPQGRSAEIGPFETLIFDLHIVSVTDAPATPPPAPPVAMPRPLPKKQ